jgi:hypothetical protein
MALSLTIKTWSAYGDDYEEEDGGFDDAGAN